MDKLKVLFLPWSPGQEETPWSSIALVSIRFKGLPYHCWSQNFIPSFANTIGQPIKLDNITLGQEILSFARVLVNIDLSKPKPDSIIVDLQGEKELEIDIEYENRPCPHCLSVGHNQQSCPFSQSGCPNKALASSVAVPFTSKPSGQVLPSHLTNPNSSSSGPAILAQLTIPNSSSSTPSPQAQHPIPISSSPAILQTPSGPQSKPSLTF